jgi:predicted signal transduction protein with EAL and GGDEF domain
MVGAQSLITKYTSAAFRERRLRPRHNGSGTLESTTNPNVQRCHNHLGILSIMTSGYSSPNYLRKFPFQKIKIDQSFIQGLDEKPDAQAIIGAVAGLGASLDKIVVAEGIETDEQMKQVKAHGCHEGQGHLFGEPMPADVIRARLETSTSVAQLVA